MLKDPLIFGKYSLPDRKKIVLNEEPEDDAIQSYKVKVNNPWYKERPATSEECPEFYHPKLSADKDSRELMPKDVIKVTYIDRNEREVITEWTLEEYLKKIGIRAGKDGGKYPYDMYRELIDKNPQVDINELLKTEHQRIIQTRFNHGYEYDKQLRERAMSSYEGKRARENQERSQFEEDPYFTSVLESGGYVYPTELLPQNDYLDAIDVLVEVDIKDGLDEEWEGEPVYIGVQRTLLEEGMDRLALKKRQIENNPFWNLPEYPDKSPILRILYVEKPGDYYLSNSDSRLEAMHQLNLEANRKNPNGANKKFKADSVITGDSLSEIKEGLNKEGKNYKKINENRQKKVVSKTLDILYLSLDSVLEYKNDRKLYSYFKDTIDNYEKSLAKMISIIEEDNDLDRKKVKELLK